MPINNLNDPRHPENIWNQEMWVSKVMGPWGTPKSSMYRWIFHCKASFLNIPIYGNPQISYMKLCIYKAVCGFHVAFLVCQSPTCLNPGWTLAQVQSNTSCMFFQAAIGELSWTHDHIPQNRMDCTRTCTLRFSFFSIRWVNACLAGHQKSPRGDSPCIGP